MSGSRYGIFGIDLGTTYSVVGYIDDTGRAAVTRNSYGLDTTPSVVFFESEGNVVVGKAAQEAVGQYPDQVVSLIKREMGNREYRRTFFGVEHTPPSISALILEALAREAEQDTGRKVTDVVITAPAYFGLLEEDATRKAGEIAGLNVIDIVPEPVAAAWHYGATGSTDGTTILVYDLGGATFDVSLIKMTEGSGEVLALGGDHRLGGADWDKRLLDHFVEQTIAQCGDDSLRDDEPMLLDLRMMAEETKKALSTAKSRTQRVRYTGTPAAITVTRAQFEQMTADLLDETVRITRRTLAEAEEKYPGISMQISEVLLVGGSSKMPAVSDALRKEFGWDPRLADPDLAVAKGAALHAKRQVRGLMRFDETRYTQDFIKKLRGARSLPDDLLARYAITLPATDPEISVQLKAVRAYWNKASSGGTYAAQTAKMCRAEDERLRAQHGSNMEKREWWEARQGERRSAAQESLASLAEELRRTYGEFGVVTAATLDGFADKLGLTQTDALQAAGQAGLTLVDGVRLPDSAPLPPASFEALLKYMSECAVSSVPELVHPGAGSFSLIDRYVCTSDRSRRLDMVALERQSAEADKRGVSATENARRAALMILRRAARDGVDLREIALYHLIKVAEEYVPPSMRMAVAALRKAGLERRDAAVIAVLLGDQSAASGAAGLGKVHSLLVSGRLNEARQAALNLPAEYADREEAIKKVEAAREHLDALLAKVRQALQVPDEGQAAALLREAAAISLEDAEAELAAVPPAPPSSPRAVCDGETVKLFWQPAAGHDEGTTYVVTRTEQRPPAAPDDGSVVHRGRGNSCTDAHAPVAREVHYGVFAIADGRPASRPATVAVTLLPPVSRPSRDLNGRQAKLFISYSHRDERHLKRLEIHLANLRREGVIADWHDRMITPGEEWRSRIGDSLESADCVLLLVTPDFIASDYCYSVEMERALERHRQGRVLVLPVIVRPADWQYTPLRELQALPKDGKPIVEWANRDRAWLNVTGGLRLALVSSLK